MYESPYSVSITEKVTKEISEGIDAFVMKITAGANITVDRDELLKALAYDRGQYETGYGDGYNDGKRDAGQWISAKERLPDVMKEVIVCDKTPNGIRYVTTAFMMEDCAFWNDCGKLYEVTHWMPLPEPPKEVER